MVKNKPSHWREGCFSIMGNKRIERRICAPESKPEFGRPMVVMRDTDRNEMRWDTREGARLDSQLIGVVD